MSSLFFNYVIEFLNSFSYKYNVTSRKKGFQGLEEKNKKKKTNLSREIGKEYPCR